MQYRTVMIIDCVGSPMISNGAGRKKCDSSVSFDMKVGATTYERRQIILEATKNSGWRRLKTLGQQQYLCKSCTNTVIEQRKLVKERWG